MKNKKLTVKQFRNLTVLSDFIQSPGDMDSTPPEGFLYQVGYLTIRPGISNNTLTLDYPNTEVLNSMSNLLTQNIKLIILFLPANLATCLQIYDK